RRVERRDPHLHALGVVRGRHGAGVVARGTDGRVQRAGQHVEGWIRVRRGEGEHAREVEAVVATRVVAGEDLHAVFGGRGGQPRGRPAADDGVVGRADGGGRGAWGEGIGGGLRPAARRGQQEADGTGQDSKSGRVHGGTG